MKTIRERWRQAAVEGARRRAGEADVRRTWRGPAAAWIVAAGAIAGAGAIAAAAPSDAVTVRFGQAAVDITPPPNMPFQVPQRPPFQVVPASGTHDPLYAKAMVFEGGGTKAAIVACDLTSIPVHFIAAAREHVGRISGVPPENVMISATHTHTGPNIRPRFFANATPEQKRVATEYLERLPRLMAESVARAERALTPARLSAASGTVPGVAFNRRFLMKDGTVVSNPHKGDDARLVDVVRPAGPTDPSLPVLYAETGDGKPLATAVNFALHLDTTGGTAYSADFPHQIARILAEVKGPGMLSHFTIGAAGNINHYYLLDPARVRRTKGYGEAARIGTLVAAEVLRAYERLEPLPAGPVKVSRETLRLRILESKAPAVRKQFGDRDEFHDGEMVVTTVDGKLTFAGEVMTIAVGDELAFVGLPGEMFVELGLAVKQNSPYRFTFVNTLANGSIGYVANRKAYREGSYGAAPASTRSEPGTGEALVESAVRQLVELRGMRPTP